MLDLNAKTWSVTKAIGTGAIPRIAAVWSSTGLAGVGARTGPAEQVAGLGDRGFDACLFVPDRGIHPYQVIPRTPPLPAPSAMP